MYSFKVGIVDYYKSYIDYYDQFTGRKARSVEGDKNLAMVVLAQIYGDLQKYNFDDLVKEVEGMPQLQGYLSSLSFSNQLGSLISGINEAVRSLDDESQRQQAIETMSNALTELENAGEQMQDSEVKAKIVEVTQFIYSVAARRNINELLTQIQQSNVLTSYVNQGQSAQPNISMMP